MDIKPFETEQFFSLYEFSSEHLLGVSDCETVVIAELLELGRSSFAELGRVRLGYTESTGNPELRRAISALYENISAEDIVVLGSPVEGIYLTMRSLLETGSRVIVLSPAYDALFNVATHVAGRAERWPLRATSDSWALDLETLERLLEEAPRHPRTLVVVNFPHNPTGYLPSPSEFDSLLEIVRSKEAWLLCDEMYRGAEFDRTVEPIPSAADRFERTVVLGGLSKAYGLPGLRCGWVVIRDESMRSAFINWKHYTSICASTPTEFLARVALENGAELLSRCRSTIAENVTRAEAFFAARSDRFTWRRPKAGSVALVGLDVPSATEYCHALAHDAGIVLLPGTCLGYDDFHVRFGFGRRSFATSLDAFERYVDRGG